MNAYDQQAEAPYRLHLEFNDHGRIVHKVEQVKGKAPREQWYTYTGAAYSGFLWHGER